MDVIIPNDLTAIRALEFCERINNTPQSEEYNLCFDILADKGTVEPFGMLLISTKIRQFIAEKEKIGAKLNFRYYNLNTYAAHMGFYESCRLRFGNAPGQASGSSNYIPMTSINVDDFRDESRGAARAVGNIIERKAAQLASVLSRKNENLKEYLTYSIREIMRNVEEHSRSKHIWLAGQYWANNGNIVEIAILDEGVGIRETLSEHPQIRVRNDEDALMLALEPAITGNQFAYGDNDPWSNSGYGLYMTSSICQNGGDFIISSGSRALILNESGHQFIPTSFKGTAIRMRIHVPRIGVLQDILRGLADKGAARAQQHSLIPFKSASLVSRMLVED